MGEATAIAPQLIWTPVSGNPEAWYCSTEFGQYLIHIEGDHAAASLNPAITTRMVDGIEYNIEPIDIGVGTHDEIRDACAEHYRVLRASMRKDWMT